MGGEETGGEVRGKGKNCKRAEQMGKGYGIREEMGKDCGREVEMES